MEIIKCPGCNQEVAVPSFLPDSAVWFRAHSNGSGGLCMWRGWVEKDLVVPSQKSEGEIKALQIRVEGLEAQLSELGFLLGRSEGKFALLEGVVQVQVISLDTTRTLLSTYYHYLMELREEVGKRR